MPALEFYVTNVANNQAREYARIQVSPVAGSLGAEIGSGDLRKLDAETFAEIKKAALDHLVIFFRDQPLSLDKFEAFARYFGEPGEDPFLEGLADLPHVARVLKEADEKTPFVFGAAWHSDWSFREAPPPYTLLFGRDIPKYGRDTLYSNLELTYNWLPDELKQQCDGLTVLHSAQRGYGPDAVHNELYENVATIYKKEGLAVQEHPLVRTHPETGRKAIFANPAYTVGIKNTPAEKSEPLLEQIYDVARNPVFTCRFRWTNGAVAIWDNRCTWHHPIADYHGARRELFRTTIAGDRPI